MRSVVRDGWRLAVVAIGWIGLVHPAIEKQLDLGGRVYAFELDLTATARARVPAYAELSKFPAIRRDLAVVVAEDVPAGKVHACLRARAGEWLRESWLFDVYRGKGIDENHKSLAFGLILQDFSRTLADADVDSVLSGIIAGLHEEFGATLRV